MPSLIVHSPLSAVSSSQNPTVADQGASAEKASADGAEVNRHLPRKLPGTGWRAIDDADTSPGLGGVVVQECFEVFLGIERLCNTQAIQKVERK